MIYHVNERKKRTSPESLFCPPHSSSLVFLLRLGYCRAHPTQIWTNFLRLSLEIFVLFKYLMMCVASSMSSWLWIWPPWKEPKTPENNQIVKVSSTKNKNYSTTTRNYCYIYLHTCRIFRRWTKYKFLCQLTEREKIPKPSFAGLPTIKLKQSYYHVYVDL